MLRRLSGKGKVLEIAGGTGRNLRYNSHDSRIISVDISGEMLKRRPKRAAHLSMDISFLLGEAEVLPFSDESFNTVVSSRSTCTFPNPVSALREMARVCKPEGRIFLLEHGRSDREWLGRWQDRREDSFARYLGCHWNREPVKILHEAGLTILRASRKFLGIFHLIEAKP